VELCDEEERQQTRPDLRNVVFNIVFNIGFSVVFSIDYFLQKQIEIIPLIKTRDVLFFNHSPIKRLSVACAIIVLQ